MIAEFGVHTAEPGQHRLVVFLCAKQFNDRERILEGRRGLVARDILTARPATYGLKIPDAGNRGDQGLTEQLLKRARRSGD